MILLSNLYRVIVVVYLLQLYQSHSRLLRYVNCSFPLKHLLGYLLKYFLKHPLEYLLKRFLKHPLVSTRISPVYSVLILTVLWCPILYIPLLVLVVYYPWLKSIYYFPYFLYLFYVFIEALKLYKIDKVFIFNYCV